jgi:hypothetical protein
LQSASADARAALAFSRGGSPLAQRALRQAGVPNAAGAPHSPAATPWATAERVTTHSSAAAAAASQPWSGSTMGGGGGAPSGSGSFSGGGASASQPFPFIPISAAALGRLPARRSGQPVTGADIMEEALAEEVVGAQAAQLVSRPGALDAAAAAYAAAQRNEAPSGRQ